MGVDAATPPGFREQVAKLVEDKLGALLRSGFLRSASIGEGGLTIRGGFLRLVSSGFNLLYAGPISPSAPDGTPQQGVRIRRADGTIALQTRDAFPGADGTFNQALSWLDRDGNTVLADDTDGGQGIARPWLSGGFTRTRYADMTVATTATAWETLWDQRVTKQQPRLEVAYRATMDTDATAGETRVLVNGVQLGATAAEAFQVATHYIGPAAVAGDHMSELVVEIQARVTSGAAAVRVEPLFWKGQQS